MTMTATQLQRLLDSVDLSQRRGADAIGIGERTMRRYIAGETMPTTTEYALRWVAHCLANGLDPATGRAAK